MRCIELRNVLFYFATCRNTVFAVIYGIVAILLFVLAIFIFLVSAPVVGASLIALIVISSDTLQISIPSPTIAFLALGSLIVWVLSLRALPQCFRRMYSDETFGVPTTLAPLLQLTNDIADKTNVKRFDRILLTPDAGAATAQIGNRRLLLIGLMTIEYLTVDELRAVIAHECGHHHQNAMLVNRMHNRNIKLYEAFRASFSEVVDFSNRQGMGIVSSFTSYSMVPQILVFLGYGWFLSGMSRIVRNKEYEFYCDSVAVRAVGGKHIATALERLTELHLAISIGQNGSARLAYDRAEFRLALRQVHMEMLGEKAAVMKQCSSSHPATEVRIRRALGNRRTANVRTEGGASLLGEEAMDLLWMYVRVAVNEATKGKLNTTVAQPLDWLILPAGEAVATQPIRMDCEFCGGICDKKRLYVAIGQVVLDNQRKGMWMELRACKACFELGDTYRRRFLIAIWFGAMGLFTVGASQMIFTLLMLKILHIAEPPTVTLFAVNMVLWLFIVWKSLWFYASARTKLLTKDIRLRIRAAKCSFHKEFPTFGALPVVMFFGRIRRPSQVTSFRLVRRI